MKFIKPRNPILIDTNPILESISNSRLEDAYVLVRKILTKKIGELAGYDSDWYTKTNDGEELMGRLFRTVEGKAIRLNWKKDDTHSIIISLSLWKEVELGGKKMINNPDYTIQLNGASLSKGLMLALDYFSKVGSFINENIKGMEAEMEDSTPVSLMDFDGNIDDMNLDIFDTIHARVMQVAYGYGTSLIITGMSGVGKSFDTKKALQEVSRVKNIKDSNNFKFFKGDVSTSGLYDILFRYHDQLIVFDDMDNVFKDDASINILKSALETEPEREVTRSIQTHFNTDGMTMKDIMANYIGDVNVADDEELFKIKNKGKLPKSFIFTGRVIFISNLSGKDFDKAIRTRVSAHIDVQLTHEELLTRMRFVMDKMKPHVKKEDKEEVLELIDYLTLKYETKSPLSIRTLGNAIDTMVANDRLVNIGGRRIPLWQALIKNDMVGKIAKLRV